MLDLGLLEVVVLRTVLEEVVREADGAAGAAGSVAVRGDFDRA